MNGLSFALVALASALVLLGPEPVAAAARARLDGHSLKPTSSGAHSLNANNGHGSTPRRRAPVRIPPAALPAGCSLGCGLVCVLVAGVHGAVAALVVMPVVIVVMRRQLARAPDSVDETARSSLPLTCDLVAAGLRAGASVPTALSSAAVTTSGSIRTELLRVAALLRLGTSAPDAWRGLVDDPVLGPVAAVASRSADSGIKLADALTRSAATLREDLLCAATARAERVGVMALIPLGLCFLPAFICLGVVPIIAGVAAEVFSRVAS